jgi:hypothetical protein
MSGTYHSTSTDGYQLSIAHLVDKDNTYTTRVMYGRVLPCNLSQYYPRTLYVVHNTSPYRKTPTTTGPTCDDMHVQLIE